MRKIFLIFLVISLLSIFPSLSKSPTVFANVEICEINPNTVSQGEMLTYRVKWPERVNEKYYFGRSWDKNNPEEVQFDTLGILEKKFSAPTNPGTTYEVYINSSPEEVKKGFGDCFKNFSVTLAAPGTSIPTPLPTNTPIPTPTQAPELVKNCPVCPQGYTWHNGYNTCFNPDKKPGDKDYYINPTMVNCPTVGACSIGCGCDPSCKNKPDPNIVSPCVGGICQTAVGNIPTDPAGLVGFLFKLILGLSGGIALILIIVGAYQMMTSQGNPERLQGAKETITSAIVGLLFIIFSFLLLEIIGVDILQIPGFTK